MVKMLIKMSTRKVRKKKEHRNHQIDYGQALNIILEQLGQIFDESKTMSSELDTIFKNAHQGIASPFLHK